MKTYPSNLSKRHRHMILPFLPKHGNPHCQKWTWKVILNALFYVLRTACQCLRQSGTPRGLPTGANFLTPFLPGPQFTLITNDFANAVCGLT